MDNAKKNVLVAIGCLVVLLFFGVSIIQWGSFQQYLAKRIIDLVTRQVGWYVDFKKVTWHPLSELRLTSMAIYANGKQLVSVQEVAFSYSLSWRKPFIVPRVVSVDKPLVVGELDESGKVINLPEISKKDSSGEKPFINIPSPELEIKNGRIVVIKNGGIVASLKDVSARAKVAVSPGENKIQVKISDGNFFAEKPLLETLRWNGVVTISKDGIVLRSFNAFSKYWGVLTGSGFWGPMDKRGFFRFSVQNLTFSALVPCHSEARSAEESCGEPPHFVRGDSTLIKEIPFAKYLGVTSVDGEVTISPSSLEMNYNIVDSHLGQVRGTLLVKQGEKLRIVNRANFSLTSSFEKGSFDLHGRIASNLEMVSGEDIAGYGDVSLGSSKIALNTLSPVFIDRGFVKWKFGKEFLELDKIDVVGPLGKLVARAYLQRNEGLKALLEWKVVANQNGQSGNIFLAKSKIPVNQSSGLINLHCGDLLCRDIRSIKASGKILFASSGSMFLAEGDVSEKTVALMVRSKIDNLSEWTSLLGLPFNVTGLFEMDGTFNGSIDEVDFQLKGNLVDSRIKDFFAKRLGYESKGRIRACRSSSIRQCQGIAVGNVTYSVEQDAKVVFDKIQTPAIYGARKVFNGLLTISQTGGNIEISGNVKSDDGIPSGKFVARIENIWKRPLFSITDASLVLPKVGNLTLNLRGTFLNDGEVDIESFRINKDDQLVVGSFSVSRAGRLKGRVTGENIALLEDFLSSKGVKLSGGRIGGELLLGGSLESPEIQVSVNVKPGSLMWERGTSDHLSWDRFIVEARLERGNMSGKVLFESPNVSNPLQAKGSIPVQFSLRPFRLAVLKDKPISGTVDLSELDLAYIALWFLPAERVEGTFSLHANFSGTIANPKVDGEGFIRRGKVEIKRGYVISDIDGLIKFEQQGINIAKVSTKGFNGEAIFHGFIPYDDWHRLKISGLLKDVAVPRFYGITGRGSGEAALTIVQGHPFIEGNFKISEASLDLAVLKDTLRKNIDVVSASDRSSSKQKEESSLDFALKLFLDLSDAKAKVVGLGLHDEVTGKLWVVKNLGGRVGLEGKIEHRRGWYEFGDAKIEFSEGYALFKGSPDPDLFLVGTKKIRDIEITVKVIGRGSEPEVVMSSDPPLDRIDMVSYLLFNRPATGLTGSEGLALQTQAAALIGSQASKVLKKSIGDTPFTPDVVQMRGSDSGQSSVIEIGKYITPDFYVTYEKDLRSSGEDNFKVEYRLNRHLSIQTQIGSQNKNGVDLLWRYDFGK
jgi:autotransporter translocation and assembly factor TamB